MTELTEIPNMFLVNDENNCFCCQEIVNKRLNKNATMCLKAHIHGRLCLECERQILQALQENPKLKDHRLKAEIKIEELHVIINQLRAENEELKNKLLKQENCRHYDCEEIDPSIDEKWLRCKDCGLIYKNYELIRILQQENQSLKQVSDIQSSEVQNDLFQFLKEHNIPPKEADKIFTKLDRIKVERYNLKQLEKAVRELYNELRENFGYNSNSPFHNDVLAVRIAEKLQQLLNEEKK